ncbi:MAG: PKD domain-containing protein, partial [Candidatus Aenigmarchaeota archaeon]|nr:PKD domain-containing protein [Candidatus Aenigmarchaeota archaeon]
RTVNITSLSPNITSFYPDATIVNIAEPENQIFNITATDPEGADLNFRWYMNGSLGFSSINQTEWNFTGNYSTAGIHNITVVVSDGHSADSNEWTLVVNNTNRAPVLGSVIPAQLWGEDINKTINLSLYFNELDNEDMSFSSTDIKNITVYINNDTDTAVLKPDAGFIGIRYVVFMAFDIYGVNVSSNNVTLNITGNHIPEVRSISIICSDSSNQTNGDLTGSFVYYDMDNDEQCMNETRWYNNSIEVVSLRNMTDVDSGHTLKNQTWTFSARVFDGTVWGEWLNETIVIKNSAPETPSISSPLNNGHYNSVNITYSSSDLDNDIIYYYVYINESLDSVSLNNITGWVSDDGYYSLKACAYDNESFGSNSSVVYFIKDTIEPQIISINSSDNLLTVATDEDATCRYSSSDVS